MQAEGLVQIQPQRGSVVSLIRLCDARENMFLRRSLEVEAVRNLAPIATPGLRAGLRRNLVQQAAALAADDRAAFHQLDLEFHEMILDALGFHKVKQAVESARITLDRIRRILTSPDIAAATRNEHERIVAAIEAGDGDKAASAMRAHLDAVMVRLMNPCRKAAQSLYRLAGRNNVKTRLFKAPSGASIQFTELGSARHRLGNLFRALSEEEAQTVLAAQWEAGIRYIDTAPLYGLGLSETRLNHFLRGKPRDSYVISTKVGRLLKVCQPEERTGIGKFFDTPARQEVYDYSYDGVMRSLEFSFERLGIDTIDILFVHDIDVANHGSIAQRDAHVADLMKGGYKALVKLRDEKVIKAFGAGVNEWEVCEDLARQGDFDLFLLAGRYTLLEQQSLDSMLPLCEKRGIGIVIGGAYNSGILASGPVKGAVYNYVEAPQHILDRVAKLQAVCEKHSVKLVEAALRFPLMHRSVVSVIPGAVSPREVELNMRTLNANIPSALWSELKAQGLLHADTPHEK